MAGGHAWQEGHALQGACIAGGCALQGGHAWQLGVCVCWGGVYGRRVACMAGGEGMHGRGLCMADTTRYGQ